MKQTELIVLGLAGLAVFMIVKGGKKPAAATTWRQPYKIDEILNTANPGQTGYGWRNFTDSTGQTTSISPDGKYYLNGQYVYG